jgi:Tfp pilus assembly protein PilX
MTRLFRRTRRDERGAALVLAIAFMVVAGTIAAALLPSINSSLQDRGALDSARNREYDAEAAIDTSIARIRTLASPGVTATGCPEQQTGPNGTQIYVTCTNQRPVGGTGTGGLALQNNVLFTACVGTSSCTNPIITAQVNYVINPISGTVSSTVLQAWSVNG